MQRYRITDKQNVFCHGKKTLFKIYERFTSGGSFTYAGQFMAKGWDADDEYCIATAIDYDLENDDDNN